MSLKGVASAVAAATEVTAAAVLTSGRIPMGDGARGLADTGAGTIGTSLAIAGATIGTNALAVTGTVAISGATTAASVSTTGIHAARSATATPAAASAVAGLVMGSAVVGIYWGTGDPDTALTAPKGSLYLRTDGSSSSTRAYINTDSSTAWTNLVTAG